jgi:hypothetical protein
MRSRTISLKSRVRYEGRAQIIDRRQDLETLPDPIWRTVGLILGTKFKAAKTAAAKKASVSK